MNRLVAVLVLLSFAITRAEQVPCVTDPLACGRSESQSVVNNNHYCCDAGFSMQWRRDTNSSGGAPLVCVCERFYFISECLEGQGQCQGATSMTSDGYKVKCCHQGDRLSSVSNSMINGVMSNYCKCYRYLTTTASGQHYNQRDLTALEEMQFLGAMGLLPEELQATVNQMSGVMNPNPGANLGHWAMSFAEGLVQGFVKAVSEANSSRINFPRRHFLRRYGKTNLANNHYGQITYPAMMQYKPQVLKSPHDTNAYFQGQQIQPLSVLLKGGRGTATNPYSNIRPTAVKPLF